MKPSIKSPVWAKKNLLILIAASTILAGLTLIFGLNLWVNAKSGSNPVFDFPQDNDLSIIQGNALLARANPSLPEPEVKQRINMVITAYSSTTWQTDQDPFITASGSSVKEGIVANNLLSFGTKVRIPAIYGDRIFTIEDRMNRRKGYYHLDIWFPDYWQAMDFGAKKTYVEVLES